MSALIDRRQFFRGDFTGRAAPLRPPWAISEYLFTALCNQCGDCLVHCPTGIIESGSGNYPVINFSNGECLFCGDCVAYCKTGALKQLPQQPAWSITATINSKSCMAFHGVECRSCYDPCEAHAINMQPKIGGVPIPVLDEQRCTGCGACFSVCPVGSIEMRQSQERS